MSILSIASSALISFQKAMNVNFNNVANHKTPGYSRQNALFAPNSSQRMGNFFNGNGVNVAGVRRFSDAYVNQQTRTTHSSQSKYQAFYEQAVQIDKLLSQEGSNVSSTIQSFITSLGQLNGNPGDMSGRNDALIQARILVERFNTMQQKLESSKENVQTQIGQNLDQINQLTKNIADLNAQLLDGNSSPNLLDARDDLLEQLSQFTEISTIIEPSGVVNVSIASGESLVIGGIQRTLSLGQRLASGTTIFVGNGAGLIDVTAKFTTGSLGGLKDYENNILNHASQVLNQMALGLAQNVNAQHQLGVDLDGELGKALFTDFNSLDKQLKRSQAAFTNAGSGVLKVKIDDPNQLKLSDYDVYVTNAASQEVRIVRKSDGQSTVMNWTSSPPAPPAGQIQISGMTIEVDDVSLLVNNDKFTLDPVRDAASDLNLNIQDARQFALASAVRVQKPSSNSGTGSIRLGNVFNTTNVNKNFRIEFISDTQYNIINDTDSTTTGPMTFTPGNENTILIPDSLNPSYSIVISGNPNPGDQFSAEFNRDGQGDNANCLKLTEIMQSKLLNLGSESLFDKYAAMVATVGSKTFQAELGGRAADILYQQALDFREEISGVNLDEEGANILSLQKSYEAAGRLMAVANQILNVVFDMLR